MSLSTFLESKNKELLASLFEWQEKVRQYSVVINAQHTRIAELEKERDMWKSNHDNQVKLKSQLMDRPDLKDRAESIEKLNDRIRELESAIKTFIKKTGLGKDQPTWTIEDWNHRKAMELINALLPKHKEPPHSHPTQIQPQEFESPQTEPNQ